MNNSAQNQNKEHKQCEVEQQRYGIYDGLFTKKIKLALIKSNKVIKAIDVRLQLDNDAKMNALKYRYPLNYLGNLYKQVVVPCTPAYELSSTQTMNNYQNNQNIYIVKVPNSSQSNQSQAKLIGIASGKRSAICLDKNKNLLRFKGCGNNCQGFPKQNNQSRGHHFFHTGKRELYITKHINNILKERLRINPPANQPLYMFDYPAEAIKQLNLSNHLPLVNKYCCVFKTQGDRRVGTHLISPLQILFMSLVDHEKNQWKDRFIAKSRYQDNEPVDLVANFELFLSPGDKFLQVYDSSKQISNYILLHEQKIVLIQDYAASIQKIVKKFVPEKYRQRTIQLLSKVNLDNFENISEIILNKIGFQMGQIKRVMCENQISWGFYLDHGIQWHCNAHLNNFIVTQPKSSKQNQNYFVLPLDYDLAYTSKQFICIDLDSPSYGQYSQQVFQNYLCGEFSAMEMSLFGLQLMNFRYGIEQEQNKGQSQNKKMARIVFRDTLVNAFNSGMRDKKQFGLQCNKRWDENIQKIKNLVQACLYLSIQFNT